MGGLRVVTLLLPLICLASPTFGSDVPPVSAGDRVRITPVPGFNNGDKLIGEVVEYHPDRLVLDVPDRGDRLIVPSVRMERLEISAPGSNRKRRTLLGAGIGLVAGATLGFAISRNSWATLEAAALGGAAGTLLGGTIGYQTAHGETWVRVPDPLPAIGWSVRPGADGGLVLAAGRRF